MFKKCLSVLLAVVCIFSMAIGVSASEEVFPEEKILIGVELYDPTDTETLDVIEYLTYLSDNLNIEFKYSEAIGDAEDEIHFIEDCAISGCQAYIGIYNVARTEAVRNVINYGMYYWGKAAEEDIFTEFKNNDHYLGDVHYGDDDYNRGYALGQWVLEEGLHKVIYANGGADFGVDMFVRRQNGFLDGIEGGDVEVITVSGFPGEQFFADQSTALSQEGVEAVVASFNGVNFWAQPIETAGLTGKVKLATIGTINEACLTSFESGALSFLSASNYQRYGLGVGIIINAVQGNKAAYEPEGEAINQVLNSWTMTTAEEAAKYLDILKNERVYSADDVKSLCVSVNPEANLDTLIALIDSATSEALMSR